MISLTRNALIALRNHGLDDDTIAIAVAIAEEIEAAADDVASDTREDSFDDSTSRGQLQYRRARNRVIFRFRPDLEVSCDTSDNALHIRFRGTAFSFYSARDGIERPSVQGSASKKRVVNESQLMLEIGDQALTNRLIVMHESGADGLIRLGVGALANSTAWSWNVPLYDRYAAADASVETEDHVGYDQRPAAQLPPLTARETGERQAPAEDEAPVSYDKQPEAELPDMPPRRADETETTSRSE